MRLQDVLPSIINDDQSGYLKGWFIGQIIRLLEDVTQKYMIFHTKKKKVQSLTVKIDNVNIERIAEFNFLGLTLDEHLDWKCHKNKLSNKISQCMGILNSLKRFLPIQTKVLIYNSLVLSHLNFGILLWGFKCDKKIVRILSLSKYNAHTAPLFKILKLLKVNDIFKLQ